MYSMSFSDNVEKIAGGFADSYVPLPLDGSLKLSRDPISVPKSKLISHPGFPWPL